MAIKNITGQKTNWKYILIVVILSAIVGGGILWCEKKEEISFTPLPEIKKPEITQDEIANWKIYRDEIYGYQLKYPPDWHCTSVMGHVNFSTFACFSKDFQPLEFAHADFDRGEIYIQSFANGNNLGIEDFIKNGQRDYPLDSFKGWPLPKFSTWFKNYTHEQITINGYPGVKFDSTLIQNTTEDKKYYLTVVWIKGRYQIFELHHIYKEKNKQKEEIFDRILSTFKPVRMTEIIEWETFSNKETSITFKYPAAYKREWQGEYPSQWNCSLPPTYTGGTGFECWRGKTLPDPLKEGFTGYVSVTWKQSDKDILEPNFKLAGYPAKKIYEKEPFTSRVLIVEVKVNNLLYRFESYGIDAYNLYEIFDYILESVSFLKPIE